MGVCACLEEQTRHPNLFLQVLFRFNRGLHTSTGSELGNPAPMDSGRVCVGVRLSVLIMLGTTVHHNPKHVERKLAFHDPKVLGSIPTPTHFSLNEHYASTHLHEYYPKLAVVLHRPNGSATAQREIISFYG